MEHQCEECKVLSKHFEWCSQHPPNRIATALESIAKSLQELVSNLQTNEYVKLEKDIREGKR